MKTTRLILMAGLVVACCTPAWAVTVPGGPVHIKMDTWVSGTTYSGLADGTYTDPAVFGPAGTAGPGAKSGEDTWGIFKITTINTGNVLVPHQVIDSSGATPPFSDGDGGKELAGIFWGGSDAAVTIDGTETTTESIGLKVAIWEQNAGTFTQGGPGARGANPWEYAGIGDHASSSLWLTAESTPGLLNGGALPATAEVTSTFDLSGGIGTFAGTSLSYFQVGSVAGVGEGSMNSTFDTDWFWSALFGNQATADFRLFMNTEVDTTWSLNGQDPLTTVAVPEPITMFAAISGLGGLGMYLKRRNQRG
jgi:hypothetical protein